jgi:hypothetical protein
MEMMGRRAGGPGPGPGPGPGFFGGPGGPPLHPGMNPPLPPGPAPGTRGGGGGGGGAAGKVCIDYHERGVCSRGTLCPYDHPDRIIGMVRTCASCNSRAPSVHMSSPLRLHSERLVTLCWVFA